MLEFAIGLACGATAGIAALAWCWRSAASQRAAHAASSQSALQQTQDALLRCQSQLRDVQNVQQQSQSQLRQMEHLAQVGTLTGGLAHEIKNPLSTVGLNLQLLQEDLDPDAPGYHRLVNRLTLVRRETNRLRDILDDFLRYAGKMELDRQPVDLNRLLEELVDFFAPQAQLQRVRLRLRPTDKPIIAEVDAKVIKQAVLNLMLNATQAIHAMGVGGELILALSRDGDDALIDVIDTGPGIPPDMADKIFRAYYSTRRGGTGIGLAMARRIAQEHGGQLTLRSEVGKGSDFTLRLPIHVATTTPPAPMPPTPTPASSMHLESVAAG